MSVSAEQQKQQDTANSLLDQYNQQFKSPILASLASFNQSIPNIIDQLSQQCVRLTIENQTLTKSVEALQLEKTTAKTPKLTPDAGKK